MSRYPLLTLALLATGACGAPEADEGSTPTASESAEPATKTETTPTIVTDFFVGTGYRIEASLENAKQQRTNAFSKGEEVWVRVTYAVEPDVAAQCSRHADGPALAYAADEKDIAAFSRDLAREFLSYLAVRAADELFRCSSVCLQQMVQPPPQGHGSVVVAPRFACAGAAAPLLFLPLSIE